MHKKFNKMLKQSNIILILLMLQNLFAANAHSIDVPAIIKNCNGNYDFLPTTSASEHVLLNSAVRWSSTHVVDYWMYEEKKHPSQKFTEEFDVVGHTCNSVVYTTRIRMPSKFLSLLHFSEIHTKVSKNGCVRGTNMYEVTEISPLPLISKIKIRHLAKFNRAEKTITSFFWLFVDVPWYLRMFEATLVKHVIHSLKMYAEAWSDETCLSSPA